MKIAGVVAAAALIAGSAAAVTPEESYELARKAQASRNWDAAFGHYEAALRAEPDSLRFGSEYRQAVIQFAKATHPKEGAPADYERVTKFFADLTAANPKAANSLLNYGFCFVDKIPASGSITQVLMANNALTHFSKSIEIKPTWIALYTRGNSYLFWPKIFGRAQLGVNDLEAAYKMQKDQPKKSYHVRVYVSLGDGYWKTDNIDKARAIWQEGLQLFPGTKALADRLARQGDELKEYIDDQLDPNKRVGTDLSELWGN
jgi:tetratricopeptide (TPR) repeat protein